MVLVGSGRSSGRLCRGFVLPEPQRRTEQRLENRLGRRPFPICLPDLLPADVADSQDEAGTGTETALLRGRGRFPLDAGGAQSGIQEQARGGHDGIHRLRLRPRGGRTDKPALRGTVGTIPSATLSVRQGSPAREIR